MFMVESPILENDLLWFPSESAVFTNDWLLNVFVSMDFINNRGLVIVDSLVFPYDLYCVGFTYDVFINVGLVIVRSADNLSNGVPANGAGDQGFEFDWPIKLFNCGEKGVGVGVGELKLGICNGACCLYTPVASS